MSSSAILFLTLTLAAMMMTSHCQQFILPTEEPLTEKGKKLMEVVSSLPEACMLNIGSCLRTAEHISELIAHQKFCEALKYNDKKENAKVCLVDYGACEQADFDKMLKAVCGGCSVLASGLVVLLSAVVGTLVVKA